MRDLTGQRFGKWLVLSPAPNERSGKASFNVRCDCGTEKRVRGQSLISGGSSQCYQCVNRTHGDASATAERVAPEYVSWANMIQRCTNAKHPKYPDYGGRGITVCDRWRNSYREFLADVGRRPSPQHTLDRFPDVNGNYEPSNVRWADPVQQANNRRPRRVGYTRRSSAHVS